MNIKQNQYELLQRMGSITTDAEAARMTELLKARGVITFEQLDELTDNEFNTLVALAGKDFREAQ